jgi:hypothetical protein
MADSGMAIPAISPEHFLPAMGSQFPETADAFGPPVSASLRGVDGTRMSNRRSADRHVHADRGNDSDDSS